MLAALGPVLPAPAWSHAGLGFADPSPTSGFPGVGLGGSTVAWSFAGVGFGGPAAVWSFAGHRVVCEIAWRELSSGARERVRGLTRSYGVYDTFAESCAWADRAEAKAIHNAHWIDLPAGSARVTMDHCPADCVLRHLDTELEVLSASSGDERARSRALMFVAHFVGDLHAPLHVGYVSDRGGNEHEIVGLESGVDDLHEEWDRTLLASRAGDWRGYAARLHADINAIDRTLWLDGEPLAWAAESYQIVEDHVYEGLEGPGDSRLGPDYLTHNLRTAETQIKKAGVRLAALLERALGAP